MATYATRTHLSKLWVCLLIWCLPANLSGQALPQATTAVCGIQPLSQAAALKLTEQANQALLSEQDKSGESTPVTYVPIRPHIVRRADGTGGFSLASLNQAMALTNAHYGQNGSSIQFYFAGTTPDYIDTDSLFTNFPYNVDAVLQPAVIKLAANALNQYYTQRTAGTQGYAYYPANQLFATVSVIGGAFDNASSEALSHLGNYVLPHELGHNFNLIHTHGGTATTEELVTRGPGANCATTADLVCDTPADSWGLPGAYFDNVDNCPQYFPALSSARDINGDPYMPLTNNIMAIVLSGPQFGNCPEHLFTPGQYDRMQAGLALRQTHTAYTLDYPPTPMTPPGNLVARVLFDPLRIALTWQDNATTEMGYFVERSMSPTDGFVPIAGVSPNSTAFVDTAVTSNTRYYYRIRPSNTTTDRLSPVADVFTGYCRPVYTAGCVGNNGLSSVVVNGVVLSQNSGCSVSGYGQFTVITGSVAAGQPTSFTLTLLDPARPHGITIWADLDRNTRFDLGEALFVASGPATNAISGTFTVPDGTAIGPMRLRVLSAYNDTPFAPCGTYQSGEAEDYTVNVYVPISGLTTTAITGTTAQLTWNSLGAATYDLQWRQQGATTWNTITPVNGASFQLSGLLAGTAYEWQVRQSGTGAFSGPVTFTTLCPTPGYAFAIPSSTSVTLFWDHLSMPPPAFTLHWRLAGATDWTTVAIAAGTNYSDPYSLTGLASTTAYEWQVQANCSPALNSLFTAVSTFRTTAGCIVMTTIKSGDWSDPSVWSCNRVPLHSDTVRIGHLVTIPANYEASALAVSFAPAAKLDYQANARLKLGF